MCSRSYPSVQTTVCSADFEPGQGLHLEGQVPFSAACLSFSVLELLLGCSRLHTVRIFLQVFKKNNPFSLRSARVFSPGDAVVPVLWGLRFPQRGARVGVRPATPPSAFLLPRGHMLTLVSLVFCRSHNDPSFREVGGSGRN